MFIFLEFKYFLSFDEFLNRILLSLEGTFYISVLYSNRYSQPPSQHINYTPCHRSQLPQFICSSLSCHPFQENIRFRQWRRRRANSLLEIIHLWQYYCCCSSLLRDIIRFPATDKTFVPLITIIDNRRSSPARRRSATLAEYWVHTS